MKKFIVLFLLLNSTAAFADRVGGLKSDADILLTTQAVSGASAAVYPATATLSLPLGFSASTGSIGGSLICLEDGTNCPSSGSLIYPATAAAQFPSGFDAGNITATSLIMSPAGFIQTPALAGTGIGQGDGLGLSNLSFISLDDADGIGGSVFIQAPSAISGGNVTIIMPSSSTTGQILQVTGSIGGGSSGSVAFTNTVASLTVTSLISSTLTVTAFNSGVVRISSTGYYYTYLSTANTDAARGLALLRAQSSASSGDFIRVGPGVFTTTTSLGVNGVNWEFNGSTVSNITTIGQHGIGSTWSDNGTNMFFNVTGDGVFVSTNSECLRFSGGGTIHFAAREIISKGNANAAVRVGVGAMSPTLFLNVLGQIHSEAYDGIWCDQNGKVRGFVNRINVFDNGLEGAGMELFINELISGDECLNLYNNANQEPEKHKTIVTINEMRTTNLTGTNSDAISILAGQTYARINSPSMIGRSISFPKDLDVSGSNDVVISGNLDASAYTRSLYSTDAEAPLLFGETGITLKNLSVKTHSSLPYCMTSYGDVPTITLDGFLTCDKPILTSSITLTGNGVFTDTSKRWTSIQGSTVAFMGSLTSTNTTNIGWTVQAAANQACNTTCVSACVFGEDTSVIGSFVGCADATADRCICAGGN